MPNLYATFKDPAIAELFAKELREEGFLMDDLSVLTHPTSLSRLRNSTNW